MRNFSQETIDEVLDCVANDTYYPSDARSQWYSRDLVNCGLVCRQWASRCRFWLFRSLYFYGINDDVEGFLAIAETSATLPLFVRELCLNFYHPKPYHGEHVARLLQACNNLTDMSMRTLPFDSPDLDDPDEQNSFNMLDHTRVSYYDFLRTNVHPTMSAACGSLTYFCWALDGPMTISLDCIVHILTSLPALESFHIVSADSSGISSPPEGVLPSSSLPARFRTLGCINVAHTHLIFDWFFSLPDLPFLTSLDFNIPDSNQEDWASLHAYSQQAGQALESLQIKLPFSIEPPAILSHATMLHSLCLSTDSTVDIPAILLKLTSHNLRSIVLDLHDGPDIDAASASIPYNLIDKILAAPKFQGLEHFTVQSKKQLFEGAESLMPLAHARGILHFEIPWRAVVVYPILS